jgi:hypothetical protein
MPEVYISFFIGDPWGSSLGEFMASRQLIPPRETYTPGNFCPSIKSLLLYTV